jgi:hypothetical protein
MRKLLPLLLIILLPLGTPAHVNSPDVYFDGFAGPYHLLVTVKAPAVVPGIAQIEIRSADKDVDRIEVLPLKMVGAGARLAPSADAAQRSASDPQAFHGQLWIMARGSWKVQIAAEGARGKGELAVPLPATSTNTPGMQTALGILLTLLGLTLVAGIVSIVGAAGREADLAPGEQPAADRKRRGYTRAAVATVVVIAALVGGERMWRADAATNARLNYRVPHAKAELLSGNVLRLQLDNPNRQEKNRFNFLAPDAIVMDDLVPDHNHIMHLFLVRMPDMKSFWHLHPEQSPEQKSDAKFTLSLPSMPAGRYRVYADIVHANGFPETQISEIDLPVVSGKPLSGDDSGFADAAAAPESSAKEAIAQLADGDRMIWEVDGTHLKARQAIWFRFRLEDKEGKPAQDMQNYMGMAGHAVFMSNDGNVFAHVHPAGSVSMAAINIAEGVPPQHDMAGMVPNPISNQVSFPYGFPRPGDYHIFVQMKHAGRIETGVFSAHVQ